jgi:hypothetical protein
MVEPFNVRVDKAKGNMKYEIPLPPSESGEPGGTNWSKEQVRNLQTWIVNEWSGGGHYMFAITDSSTPVQTMEWVAYYSPQDFPEKVPPTLQGAFAPVQPAPGSAQASSPHQGRLTMASFPGSGTGLPLASFFQPPSGTPASQPMTQYYPTQTVPYGYATPLVPQPVNQGSNSEVTMLREALAQSREQAVQRDFERRLAEMKAESERRFIELQQTMQQMVKEMTQALSVQQRPVVDPMLEQMRESNRRLEEQLRVQQAEMARAQREAEIREEIRRTQDAQAKLIEESNRRFEAFIQQANTNKAPDPQVMMFQTMFQSQMEAMKEIARNSQSQLDRVQNFMMRPQDVLQIAKESSTSSDQVVHNIQRQYESMFGLSRQLIEQAAQLNQGGGNEMIGLVRDAGGKLAEMAEKYTGGKTKETIAAMNAQAEVAKAQAEAIKATQERMMDMARVEAAVKSGQLVQMPDGSFVAPPGVAQAQFAPPPSPIGQAPKNGEASTPPWIPPKAQRTDGSNAAPTNGNGLAGAPIPGNNGHVERKAPTVVEPRKVKGRTDFEWFGPMVPNVGELRKAVALFIEGLKKVPPEKHEGSASPEECAFVIQQAAMEIMQRQIPIPAMVELLMQGMVADFLDVLLPDAPQAYRDDVVKILIPDDSGDEEDEDEDDDDNDDDKAIDVKADDKLVDAKPQPIAS